MVWGGSLGLSPADDKLIQVERVLNLDPEPQLLASVLSKKISVGSKYVIIDIPFGKSAKVSHEKGLNLKKQFEKFGKKFGLKLKCVLTDGKEPIGNGIGPLLEIKDIIKVLNRAADRPLDLEKKSVYLAGQILELSGECKIGQGEEMAYQILESGKAKAKFTDIIRAQNGQVPTLEEIEKKLGKLKVNISAQKDGKIREIDNKKINMLAHMAGSPMDKGCGIYIYRHVGDKVKRGEIIATIYSESQARLHKTVTLFDTIKPIVY
jgi:putative thymidine phosphorylase